MKQKIINFDGLTGEIIGEKIKTYNIFDEDKGYLFKSNAFQKRMYNDIKLSDFVKDMTDYSRIH
jgi:hypothetical protein